MNEVKVVDGVKRVVEKLLGRRKQKRGYEYEVQWKGEAETSWLTRDRLEEMGFQKMLTDLDMKVRHEGVLLGRWRRQGRCWGAGWRGLVQRSAACRPLPCSGAQQLADHARPHPPPPPASCARRRRPPRACWASR